MTRFVLLSLLYIDPGSGFFVLQMLVAAAIGSLWYFRRAIKKVLGWRGSRSRKSGDGK